ncbi:MAG: hypothetical protein COW65_11105 [Cytophagales bacterium CG18_big_fil_WC_8_21_14_2_50_42_9]|nr:MAG: hypothetical protein COW65_11105 [Cytophagales bacterium CG18_big_fil_WC_8_21_14_2_50_42_9]
MKYQNDIGFVVTGSRSILLYFVGGWQSKKAVLPEDFQPGMLNSLVKKQNSEKNQHANQYQSFGQVNRKPHCFCYLTVLLYGFTVYYGTENGFRKILPD